jgi:hypothetical protein
MLPLLSFSILLPLLYMVLCCKCVCDWWDLLTLFFFPDNGCPLACCHGGTNEFRSPGLYLELLCGLSYKMHLCPAHVPLQTFLDFNAIHILIK